MTRVSIEAIPNATFTAARVADERWNGWVCPFFRFHEAMRLVAKWNEQGIDANNGCRFAARYDEQRDAFGFIEIEAEIDPDSCPERWEWFERCAGDEDGFQVYAIGAWSWCWWDDTECEWTDEGHKHEGTLTDSETSDGFNWNCSTCGYPVAAPEITP